MESKRFYNYEVFEDGRIWSYYRSIFLKPDVVNGYLQITLSIDGRPRRYKLHRLVALMFIPNPDNLPQINHLDGNKQNNHYSNLEWCTAFHNNKHARDTGLNDISASNSRRWLDNGFRLRTSKNISAGQIRNKSTAGKRNGRYRYHVEMSGREVSRKELVRILNMSQSYVDTSIRRAAEGESISLFESNNITVIDTKKSQSTIENTADRQEVSRVLTT